MGCILRRQQRQVFPIESYAVEVNEIWIAALLFTHTEEVHHAILLVHIQHLNDVPFPGCDLVFEPAGLKIVEVKLSPVVAFGKPDHLVGGGQEMPIGMIVAAFEVRCYLFLENVPNLARRGVGQSELRAFVVAGT